MRQAQAEESRLWARLGRTSFGGGGGGSGGGDADVEEEEGGGDGGDGGGGGSGGRGGDSAPLALNGSGYAAALEAARGELSHATDALHAALEENEELKAEVQRVRAAKTTEVAEASRAVLLTELAAVRAREEELLARHDGTTPHLLGNVRAVADAATMALPEERPGFAKLLRMLTEKRKGRELRRPRGTFGRAF